MFLKCKLFYALGNKTIKAIDPRNAITIMDDTNDLVSQSSHDSKDAIDATNTMNAINAKNSRFPSTLTLAFALFLTLSLTFVFSFREVRIKTGDYYFKHGNFDQAVNWYKKQ